MFCHINTEFVKTVKVLLNYYMPDRSVAIRENEARLQIMRMYPCRLKLYKCDFTKQLFILIFNKEINKQIFNLGYMYLIFYYPYVLLVLNKESEEKEHGKRYNIH